ncbi:MAG: ABC transporter ATP-binding protein [Pyrinomonadaceae bacterium]
MSKTVIQIEDLSKSYRLGVIGSKRLVDDVSRQWAKLRGKSDPLSRVGHDRREEKNGSNGSDSDEIWALKNVSFNVNQGEVLGIIGRNGAGKSTLLKILSRVTAPTSGEARVKGRIASLLEVGTGFHPELTGRENVFLNGAILGMTKAEIRKKFDEIVDFSGFANFIDTPVKRYSSGMWVRLAFAVAAHLDPEILIVDEVLAVGDAAFQERCLGKMEKVAGDGRTVLLVSHNMSTIQQICKQCVLFKNGVVHKTGVPSKVVSEYLSESRIATNVDLTDWDDRTGTGQALLTRLAFSDESGTETSTFPLGGTICFDLDAKYNQPLIDPSFEVIIHDAAGEPIMQLRSEHGGFRIGKIEGRSSVRGRIDDIGLYPGRYFVSARIVAGGRQVDFPRLCGSFQVIPAPGEFGDLHLNPKWGKYHIASEWSMNE